ncbi:hypothetical protein [Bradyrhizobium sp. AZCC 1693]|uniref:hypothetical protein n=1 Tax=Bradyrhizobium sp. AZCC 1693 TaxID=3117029 RepID=UPI002FF11D7C
MTDPRANERIEPEDIIVLRPGAQAPPLTILLPDGRTIQISYEQFRAMSLEDFDAWCKNMIESDPSDIE